ncbi:HD domain-containing protein [Candidatus Poribacteria bacterium]|nr:HD domain-containing protein [Candidatus Poribacteria bacterium]
MQSLLSATLLKNLPNPHLCHRLNAFAKARGVALYLVGGSVRDLLLNRAITDLDFALAGDAISFAKAFADQVGGAFIPLEEQPPTARIVLRETRLVLDFVQFRSETLAADLHRRDLTINAIALDFSSLLTQPTVKLIDPCNGLRDLEADVLRFLSEQVVLDDPLRLLRAYRLAAQLGFDMPESTLNLIRQHAARLPQISPERVRDELTKLLDVKNATAYLRRMDETRLLSQIIPEVEGMRGLQQNDYHHLDVWEHTLLALEMFEAKPMPDTLQPYATEIQAYLREPLLYDKRRGAIIKLALLLHDVAKPVTKTISPRGNARFIGHEKVGAEMAVEITNRLRFGGKVAKLMGCLVRNHLYMMHFVNSWQPTRRAITRFLRNTGEDWLGVLLLSYADVRASRGKLRQPDDERKTEDVMKQVADRYYQEIRPMMTRGRLITGHDIMQAFDLKPGVKIGRILKHIEDLQFEGKIHTPEEALAAARNFLEKQEA